MFFAKAINNRNKSSDGVQQEVARGATEEQAVLAVKGPQRVRRETGKR